MYSFHHLLYYTQRKYDFFLYTTLEKMNADTKNAIWEGKKEVFFGGGQLNDEWNRHEQKRE